MVPYFPRTIADRRKKSPSEFLLDVFYVTKGLMLLQVKEITGIGTPLIQNRATRGWIRKPIEKGIPSTIWQRLCFSICCGEFYKLKI